MMLQYVYIMMERERDRLHIELSTVVLKLAAVRIYWDRLKQRTFRKWLAHLRIGWPTDSCNGLGW